MIVCSCNVLSEADIVSTLSRDPKPRTPGQAYLCLGCKADCGRCIKTVRRILAEANPDSPLATVPCETCPLRLGE